MSLAALGIALLGASLGLAAAVRDAHPAMALTNCETETGALSSSETTVFELLNAYRTQNGLAPLKVSPSLSRAAAWKTENMLAFGYFDHYDLDGRNHIQRARDCGYPGSNVGENLAKSFSASAVVNAWKGSPGHNAAMLGLNWKVVGVGQAGGYFALVFGVTDDSGGPPSPSSTSSPSSTPSATPTAKPSPTPNPNGPSLVPIRRAMLQMVASE